MTVSTAFLEYDDASHRYYADGKLLMSVTQILDNAGMVSQYCRDEEARFRGSRVHELCHEDDARRLDMRKVPASLRGYVTAWRSFRRDTGFLPIASEHRVDCPQFGYAGRFDRLGTRNGSKLLVLLDIKTSKTGVVPEYTRLQLAAYAFAFNPTAVYERMGVALMPQGQYRIHTYPIANDRIDRAEWLSLCQKNTQKENN